MELENWKIQIKKGYLELCILSLIKKHESIYGLNLIEKLHTMGLNTKEGTLYPLLSRMTKEKILQAFWQTEGNKGHPRKFYQLTENGFSILSAMKKEFHTLVTLLNKM